MPFFPSTVRLESFDTLRTSGPTEKPAQQRIEEQSRAPPLRYTRLYPFILRSSKGVSKDERRLRRRIVATGNQGTAEITGVCRNFSYLICAIGVAWHEYIPLLALGGVRPGRSRGARQVVAQRSLSGTTSATDMPENRCHSVYRPPIGEDIPPAARRWGGIFLIMG